MNILAPKIKCVLIAERYLCCVCLGEDDPRDLESIATVVSPLRRMGAIVDMVIIADQSSK